MRSGFRRGTGGPGGTPLKEYGKPNTFGLAVAQKLAATGLTEAEYVQLAKRNGKMKWITLKRYIYFFEKEGFKFVLENGRYMEKKGSAILSGSSTMPQMISNGEIQYLPTKEDFEFAYRTVTSPGQSIPIDTVLDRMETNSKNKGFSLISNWRMITEKNIEIWANNR